MFLPVFHVIELLNAAGFAQTVEQPLVLVVGAVANVDRVGLAYARLLVDELLHARRQHDTVALDLVLADAAARGRSLDSHRYEVTIWLTLAAAVVAESIELLIERKNDSLHF